MYKSSRVAECHHEGVDVMRNGDEYRTHEKVELSFRSYYFRCISNDIKHDFNILRQSQQHLAKVERTSHVCPCPPRGKPRLLFVHSFIHSFIYSFIHLFVVCCFPLYVSSLYSTAVKSWFHVKIKLF